MVPEMKPDGNGLVVRCLRPGCGHVWRMAPKPGSGCPKCGHKDAVVEGESQVSDAPAPPEESNTGRPNDRRMQM